MKKEAYFHRNYKARCIFQGKKDAYLKNLRGGGGGHGHGFFFFFLGGGVGYEFSFGAFRIL